MSKGQRRVFVGLAAGFMALTAGVVVWVVTHQGQAHSTAPQVGLSSAGQDLVPAAGDPIAASPAIPAAHGKANPSDVASSPLKIRALEILASAPAELRLTAEQTQRAVQIASQAAQESEDRLNDLRAKQRATFTAWRQAQGQVQGNGADVQALQQQLSEIRTTELGVGTQLTQGVASLVSQLLTPQQAAYVQLQEQDQAQTVDNSAGPAPGGMPPRAWRGSTNAYK